jgi:hypothetical protein
MSEQNFSIPEQPGDAEKKLQGKMAGNRGNGFAEVINGDPKLIDLSKELYEGGKADITKIKKYVDVAKEKGIGSVEKLDLTGGTMMAIYASVSAEAGKPESSVKEFAFNNPAREGRLVLWSEEISESSPEKPTKSLMAEAPASTLDPEAPMEIVDLRLTFADDPEAMQQMADTKKVDDYMKEVISQIRELRNKGQKVVRITGIPMWLAQGAYFAAAREGMERLISYTLSSEMIIYDKNNPDLVGKVETKTPKEVVIDLVDREIESLKPVISGRELQKTLGEGLSRNKIELANIDLEKIPPHVALRMFDSFHSFSSSLKVAGVEIFQHLDFRSHDLIPKTKQNNPELLSKEERIPITLDIHTILEENGNDSDKTVLALAKEAVNKASHLIFSGITTPEELAIAGKVAHAAHGIIEDLSCEDKATDEPIKVKSWKV